MADACKIKQPPFDILFLINEKNCEIEDQPKRKHITGNHLVYIKVGFMHLQVFDGNMKIAPPRQSFSRS